MSILIIKQGIADSIQDLGRYGFQHQGINPTGAMDTLAAQTANLLCGNHPTEAVIELHFPAAIFLFQHCSLMAISGADFGARINDIDIPINTPVLVAKNSVLQFTRPVSGARACLAVKSGFTLPPWLGSLSTHNRAKAGGHQGRYLQKNDELHFNKQVHLSRWLDHKDALVLSWQVSLRKHYGNGPVIRITAGGDMDQLDEPNKQLFSNSDYLISPQSDRMGYRLKGTPILATDTVPLLSSGVSKGTIQLLPDGQLIILMADHQTTGGYPKLAHVISADLPKLAQMKPNETISFELVDQQTAENLLTEQNQQLLQLQNACNFQLKNYFRKDESH